MLFLLTCRFKPLTLQLTESPNFQRRAERRENSLTIMFFGARKDLAGLKSQLRNRPCLRGTFGVGQTFINRTCTLRSLRGSKVETQSKGHKTECKWEIALACFCSNSFFIVGQAGL